MKHFPIVPTLIVTVAVPAMILLGVWQLQRADWKAGLLARMAANADAPIIAKPADLMADREALSFRRVRTVCRDVRPWPPSAARAVDGRAGYRQQIWCREGRGEPLLVSLGVAADPTVTIAIAPGATFVGPLVPRNGRSRDDPAFLLVSDSAAAPLVAEAPPTPDTIPDNHRAYAVQWFLFAAVLSVIYGLWLRRRTG